MSLWKRGFEVGFAYHASERFIPGGKPARVVAVDRKRYLLRTSEQEIPAEVSGRFHYDVASTADFPCVGDWVGFTYQPPGPAIIQSVLPRTSFLQRKRPGKAVDLQMIAANIDTAFVVQSCHFDFNPRRLDRYLVSCSSGGIDPVVILSKTDLMTTEEVEDLIADLRGSGVAAPIIPVSTVTGQGLDRFHGLLEAGKTFCFVGSSGVGKSTLINGLLNGRELDTREVSGTGEGTHTTTRRELLLLENGALVIDTPGMRELGLMDATDGLEDSFADIQALARNCRFSNCTHISEPGCAVLESVKNGDLDEGRYRSYLKLQKENAHYNRSYAEKRQKDRDFGKYVRSVLKQKKR